MVSVSASNTIDRGFKPRLDATKYCVIDIYCIYSECAVLASKS